MELVFQPLSKDNIDIAIKLANSIFPDDAKLEINPEISYRVSLDKESHTDFIKRRNLISLEYFLVKTKSGDTVGITGWYTRSIDTKNTIWLGWYGVDKSERGKGYGKEILLKTIDEVKKKGFTIMKLYTSTSPDEAIAQNLYDSLGFSIVGEEQEIGNKYKKIYREKILN